MNILRRSFLKRSFFVYHAMKPETTYNYYHYTPQRNSDRKHLPNVSIAKIEPSRIKEFKVKVRPKIIYCVELFYYDEIIFVKFHPKLFETDSDKYKKVGMGLSTAEIKTFLNTCCKIVAQDFTKNSKSHIYSFIGQWYDKDNIKARLLTKRFSLYKKQVTTYFSAETFMHVTYDLINFYCITSKNNKSLQPQLNKLFETLASHNSIIEDFMTEKAKELILGVE